MFNRSPACFISSKPRILSIDHNHWSALFQDCSVSSLLWLKSASVEASNIDGQLDYRTSRSQALSTLRILKHQLPCLNTNSIIRFLDLWSTPVPSLLLLLSVTNLLVHHRLTIIEHGQSIDLLIIARLALSSICLKVIQLHNLIVT